MLLSSKILQKKIIDIVNITKSNYFTLTCVIKSFDDDKLNVEIEHIDGLTINENFVANYADDITLYAQMKPLDLMNLLEFKTSLYCAIRIDYIDMEGGDYILSEEPEIYYYVIFLKNTDDIYKKYHISAISRYHEEEVPILPSHSGTLIPTTFQLLESTAYSLHKQQLTGMYTNVDIASMLKYISKSFGVDSLDLYPVDNTVQFKHFIIPPEYAKFDQIFNYIQNKYGVYRKGLNYYFYRGVFYIYPAFDTHISKKTIINVYRGPKNSYLGMKNYFTEEHKGDITTLNIVSTADMKNIKLTEIGLEEIGTNVVFLRSDKMIDESRKLEDDKFYVNEDNNLTISSSFTQSAMKNAAIPTYISPTINLFKASSTLEQANGEMIILSWPLARPFRIIPGSEVHFYYDKEEIEDKNGIVDSISYHILKQTFNNKIPSFSIDAKLSIRIESEIK